MGTPISPKETTAVDAGIAAKAEWERQFLLRKRQPICRLDGLPTRQLAEEMPSNVQKTIASLEQTTGLWMNDRRLKVRKAIF